MKHLLITSLTIAIMIIGLSANASTTGEEHHCDAQMPLGVIPGIPAPYRVTIHQQSCPVEQYLFVQGIPNIGITYFHSNDGKGFVNVHMVGSVLYYDLQSYGDSDTCVTYWEDLSGGGG